MSVRCGASINRILNLKFANLKAFSATTSQALLMIYEIVHAVANKGIIKGKSGFCPVAITEGTPQKCYQAANGSGQ